MVHPHFDERTMGQHLDHRVYSTAIAVVGAWISDQSARECGKSFEAANGLVQNHCVGPQDVCLNINRGVATLLNDLLKPYVHVLSWVLILKACAVPEVRMYSLVELIVADFTEAKHANIMRLEGLGAIPPELFAMHFVIMARELHVGPSNSIEAELHTHRRFCNVHVACLAGNGGAYRSLSR